VKTIFPILMLVGVLGFLGYKILDAIVYSSGTVTDVSPVALSLEDLELRERLEIASKVELTLRQAAYMSFNAKIYQEPTHGNTGSIMGGTKPVFVSMKMSKDAFKTIVWDHTGKVIMGFSLFEGKIQEYRPGEKREFVTYPSTYPHGTDQPLGTSDKDCLIGSMTFSWVGVPAENDLDTVMDKASSMREKIEEGVRDLVEEYSPSNAERKHSVFRLNYSAAGDIGHSTYVDKSRSLVERWVSFQPGVKRTREYTNIVVLDKVPDGTVWTIDEVTKE
jgi:hypothetical protein